MLAGEEFDHDAAGDPGAFHQVGVDAQGPVVGGGGVEGESPLPGILGGPTPLTAPRSSWSTSPAPKAWSPESAPAGAPPTSPARSVRYCPAASVSVSPVPAGSKSMQAIASNCRANLGEAVSKTRR